MATKPLTHEQQFNRITSQKLADIRKRSAAKYTKGGKRLVRPEIAVEFDLAEFRDWTRQQFGGDEWGSRRCHYGCGRWLTVETFVPDHFKALARGGRNSLDNLVVCCSTCNDIKGSLDGDWFNFLLACLQQMPESQSQIIRERLAKSEKAASSVRMLRGQIHRFRTQPPQQEQI